MSIVNMVLTVISGLSVATNNPAIGGGSSIQFGEVSELLSVLAGLIKRGEEAGENLSEFSEMIEAIAREGRGPTPTEWERTRVYCDAVDEEEEERQKLDGEFGDLENIPEKERTDEQLARIAELTALLEE